MTDTPPTAPSAANPVRVRLAELSGQIDALDEQLANDHDSDGPCQEICSTGSTAADAARALLAAVNTALDLHRAVPLYDECNHTDRSAGTIAEHAWEAVNGDWVCGESTATCCEECRHDDGSAVDSPCATVRAVSAALGVTR